MKNSEKKLKQAKPKGSKNWLWQIIFILIAAISIWAVIAQSGEFSLADFADYLKDANPIWMIAAVVSMVCYILFEGLALLAICKALGHKQSLWNGSVYAAGDIYFSAITPSATGGQPASAYFMMKDGMSGMMVTTALVANLCMYTLGIVVIGIFCFAIGSGQFFDYGLPSQILIVIGSVFQVGLAILFFMLLFKSKLLHGICNWVLNFLCKIKIIRKEGRRAGLQARIDNSMNRYKEHSLALAGHRNTLFVVFIFNFLQRVAQIAVSVFVYIATTGASFADAVKLFVYQGFTVIGAYCLPVPGGMGVTDYMMLDGFKNLMDESAAVNLELTSRALSFYSCVLICGVMILVQYFIIRRRDRKI